MSRAILYPAAMLVALIFFNTILTPEFIQISVVNGRLHGSLIDILNRAVPVLIIALGMCLVIATRGVDLSVGAVTAVSGAVAASLIARPDGGLLSGLPAMGVSGIVAVALGVALLCGLFNGTLVAFFKVQPIVATLLLMVAGRGVAQLITNGQIITFENPGFQAFGSGSFLFLPIPIWIFGIVAAVFGLVVHGTAFGLFVRATGSSPEAAKLSGIKSQHVTLACYILCALCAGVAGLILTADIKAADANNSGLYMELDAILAVAIGGTGMAGGRFTLAGTIIGAILMQALTTTILTRGVPFEVTLILKAVLVVVVCLLQSDEFRRRVMVKRRTAT